MSSEAEPCKIFTWETTEEVEDVSESRCQADSPGSSTSVSKIKLRIKSLFFTHDFKETSREVRNGPPERISQIHKCGTSDKLKSSSTTIEINRSWTNSIKGAAYVDIAPLVSRLKAERGYSETGSISQKFQANMKPGCSGYYQFTPRFHVIQGIHTRTPKPLMIGKQVVEKEVELWFPKTLSDNSQEIDAEIEFVVIDDE